MKLLALLLVLGLGGCGGGGGAPSMCNENMPSCNPPDQPTPPDTTTPPVDVSKATCALMDTLTMAKDYLNRGATQLDADSDGKPCEEKFAQ